jgi:hypothetical protein
LGVRGRDIGPAPGGTSREEEKVVRIAVAQTPKAGVDARGAAQCLGAYTDLDGRERELIRRGAAKGSVLVIDRLSGEGGDERLVAHLFADEPAQNAQIVCALYLADPAGRRCRALTPEDLRAAPGFGAEEAQRTGAMAEPQRALGEQELLDAAGRSYRLAVCANGGSGAQLRWVRHAVGGGEQEPVTVREVVGALESYEPARTLTAIALLEHRKRRDVALAPLREELERLCASPIVLNRGLRGAVLRAVGQGVTMSEIAIRCGRVKRDDRGNESGETSWLGRRIGLLPESGRSAPTRWVHTDVLALIARQGLGVPPREAEVA